MPKLPRSLSRWFQRNPRTYRRTADSPRAQLGLLTLEERVTPTTSFAGTGTEEQANLFGVERINLVSVPPNAMGAIGPTRFVENLNGSFSIYSREGVRLSIVKANDFFNHIPGDPFSNAELGLTVYDTRILYDRNSGRWFALAARAGSFQGSDFVSDNNDLILAVSRTSDRIASVRRNRRKRVAGNFISLVYDPQVKLTH